MSIEIKVPPLGESVSEATIARWLKQAGDAVQVDEPVAELETDKVTLEVPAPATGVLSAVAVAEGATVGVNAVLATLEEGAAAAQPAPKPESAAAPAAAPAPSPVPARPLQRWLLYLRHRCHRQSGGLLKRITSTLLRLLPPARMAG